MPRGSHIILCFTMQFYAFDKKPDAFTEVTDSKMFDVESCATFYFSILTTNKKSI